MTLNPILSVSWHFFCQVTLVSHQSVPCNDHGNTLKPPASASWYWQPDRYDVDENMKRKCLNYPVPVLVMLGLLIYFVWFVSATPVVQLSYFVARIWDYQKAAPHPSYKTLWSPTQHLQEHPKPPQTIPMCVRVYNICAYMYAHYISLYISCIHTHNVTDTPQYITFYFITEGNAEWLSQQS